MNNILEKYYKKTQITKTVKRGKIKLILAMVLISLLPLLITSCSKPKKKVTPKSPVSIRSTPKEVNINLISHKRKFGATPWSTNLVKGMYVFEFTKPGYQTTWRKINCNPPLRKDLEVKMQPMTAAIIIKTEPPGVTLSSGERIIGQTPLALQNISLGIHTYILTKPGFSSREITVNVEDERPKIISESMVSNIGWISVNTTPSASNIFINNIPRGKTPAKLQLERGEYDLRVEAPGYSNHKEKISILNDETSTVSVNLQELPCSITIVTTPTGSNLTVNGQQYNNTPTTLDNLKPGEYKIVISHDKYDTSTRTVNVAAGKDLTVNVTLDTNMGGVDLVVHPPGVTVYVDGVKKGLTQMGETTDLSKVFEIRGLKSGVHTITLAHKRAQPSQIKFKLMIKKGQINRPKQVRFWVRDTLLKLKDGRTFTGRIAQENKTDILFEPDRTMKLKYDREDIEILRKLEDSE